MKAFGTAVKQRTHKLDLFLLAAVPTALVGVFLLPLTVRKSFRLSFTNPTLVDAYVSNFVHLTASHLLINLLAYLLLVPTAYLCFLLADERELFLIGYVSSLSAFPFVLSWMNTLSLTPMVGYGFSGINMAFFGLLPSGITSYYRTHFAAGLERMHAMILFFAGAILIILLVVPIQAAVLLAIALAITGVAVYGHDAIQELSELSFNGVTRVYREDPVGYGEIATVGILVYIGIPIVMFPPGGTNGGEVLNYYTHFLGFGFGFISSYLTFFLLAMIDDRVGSEQGEPS